MDFDWILSGLGMAVGAGLGWTALINPVWAAKLVRLQEAQPGGRAEFRAIYGGLFFVSHALGLLFAWAQFRADNVAISSLAVGAIAVLAAAWGGAGLGRLVSIWRDQSATRFNWLSVGFEFGVAALIAAPWIFWLTKALLR